MPQRKGYARIRQDYEDFYTRRMYYRIHVSQYTKQPCHDDTAQHPVYATMMMEQRTDEAVRTTIAVLLRLQDCFNRPIASAPDRVIDVLTRTPVNGQKYAASRSLHLLAFNLTPVPSPSRASCMQLYSELATANADERTMTGHDRAWPCAGL